MPKRDREPWKALGAVQEFGSAHGPVCNAYSSCLEVALGGDPFF